MFASFKYNYFPYVIVELSGNIKNNIEFLNFTNSWLELNERNIDFIFIFDTTNIGLINIKYCFLMAMFIKKLKKSKNNKLKKSIIIYNNKFIKSLLELIFFIEKPIANVYLTKDNLNNIIKILNNIERSNLNQITLDYNFDKKINVLKTIYC